MNTITVGDGLKLAVQDLGTGPSVVLVGGMFLDRRIWDQQVCSLTEAGYRVVCIDLLGHGESDQPLSGYAIPELAGQLVEAMRLLEVGRGLLVGHSFAGQVAFSAAVQGADLAGLVLLSSNGVAAARTAGFPFGAPAEALLPALVTGERTAKFATRKKNLLVSFGADPVPELVDWLLAMVLQTPSWVALEFYRTLLTCDQSDLVARARLPILHLYGEDDPILARKAVPWLVEQLPDLTSATLPGGHYPMLEAGQALSEALLAFCDRVGIAVVA
ncbi:MAG: alpha/beta hydrolase [Nocardioides sp.]|uniref:alpha/beta fold hydrolase n=1 Tax=Nocardioides sp. TaxID=35761 RepID=UPI0039E53446